MAADDDRHQHQHRNAVYALGYDKGWIKTSSINFSPQRSGSHRPARNGIAAVEHRDHDGWDHAAMGPT
jgi:hypothetical protein